MIPTRFPSLALVLVLVLGSTALAQAAPTTETAAASETSDAREMRRVLRLANGQTIRVVSRKSGDAWEYRAKEGWKPLAPGFVVAATLESELLREWKAKQAAGGDAAARVARAEWAAERGLALEGLEELDRVLAADPDHSGALAALGRHAWMNVPSLAVAPEELAQAKEALLRFGSTLPPAARELAVAELARAVDREALRAELERELSSKLVARRDFATLALRRIFAGESVKPLLVHAVLDPSEDVRRGAGLALRAAGDPALIVPVLKALDSKSSVVRANAAEALGTMGYAAAVEPLIARMTANLQGGGGDRLPHSNIFVGRQFAYIQDFDVEVAQFQAVADPQVNVLLEGQTTDAAVGGVQEIAVAVEQATIRKSLEHLTQASPGKSAAAWRDWWAANGSRWRSADHAAPATEPPATGKG